jgi:digeranylgeranylglycerophospholipid reductase
VECAKKDDFSKEALQPYEQMWRDRMEDKLYRNWMAKEKLITLSDADFDSVVQTLAEADVTQVNVHNILKALKEKAPDLVKEFEDLI